MCAERMYFNLNRIEVQIDETTGAVTATDVSYDGEQAKFVSTFSLSGEADGEVLVYVAATSDWQNKTLAEAGILALAGGTMAGDIAMGGNNITGAQLITLTPSGITGAGNYAIDINPSAPIAASSEFTGLRILGDSIDPAGTEAEVFGVDIELSGVSTANAPEIHGARFAMPVGYDAIHIAEGEIHHGFTTGSDVAAQYTTHDIIIDASSLDAASQVHAIDVAVTGGTPAGGVIAVATHSHVSPIVQETGGEVAPDEGLRVTSGPTYTANIDGQAVWVAKDDEIWFRYSSAFDEVEIDFSAACSKDARLEFYYYNGTIWVEFFPADDTDGGRNDGTVRFNSSDFTAWAAAGDPAGASGGNGYWMSIKRTRVASVGSPAISTLKVTVDTEYSWDATGNLSINSLTSNIATGTPPFVVASTTVVVNLNASLLGGNAAAAFAAATHAAAHENGGGDEISVAALSGLLADDQHVLDAEVLSAAATIKLDDFAAPDDNTDLDVSVAKHGLCPKGTNTGTKFLRDDATWDTPAGGSTPLFVPTTKNTSANDATSEFVITADHVRFDLFSLIPGTDIVFLHAQLSTDGGDNWEGAGYLNGGLGLSDIGTSQISGALVSSISVTNYHVSWKVGSAANEWGVCGYIEFYGLTNTNTGVRWVINLSYTLSSGNAVTFFGGGQRVATTAVNRIKFYFSADNIESGAITMSLGQDP